MAIRIYSKLIFTALLALAMPCFGKDAAAPVVKQFPLDEHTVYDIPISTDAPTTVMFPSAPTALEGARITTQPDQPAPVLLSHTPGRYYFSVRALAPDATATLNVIHKQQTYILRFAASPEPYGSVTFFDEQREHVHNKQGGRAATETLLTVLDRAKSHRLVKSQRPDAVRHVEHRALATNNVTYYKDFTVTVEEVFRFDAEDTLVFKIRMSNSGDAEIAYQPKKMGVRIGNRVYPASVTDASGLIPPRAETIAYLAITGTPAGGQGNLSIKNDFKILVPLVKRTAPRAVTPRKP